MSCFSRCSFIFSVSKDFLKNQYITIIEKVIILYTKRSIFNHNHKKFDNSCNINVLIIVANAKTIISKGKSKNAIMNKLL